MGRCLQGGALATTDMTGHGGKRSLSTQEMRQVDTKYCQLSTGPRIQQIGAQNQGKSGKLAPDLGVGGACVMHLPPLAQKWDPTQFFKKARDSSAAAVGAWSPLHPTLLSARSCCQQGLGRGCALKSHEGRGSEHIVRGQTLVQQVPEHQCPKCVSDKAKPQRM
uniref:Uncharacterized protein n=1 Tax=Eutreptiella gymnastica TaxID=73025 RepID=A0A7S4G5X6_9EUGL